MTFRRVMAGACVGMGAGLFCFLCGVMFGRTVR